jgi:hypothetical protein
MIFTLFSVLFWYRSLIQFGFASSLTRSSEVPQGDSPYLITPSGRM